MRLKNEALVGMVVVAGIVVAIAGGIWLSGRPFGQTQSTMRAAFAEVGVLAEGSPVKYRGVRVGNVTDIRLAGGGTGVLVTFEVTPDLALPRDPAVVISPESFFGDWQASIVSRATADNLDFTEVRGTDILPGATMPDITQLTAVAADIAEDMQVLADRVQIAFTEETARDIRETIENVQEVSAQLGGFIDQQTRTYAAVSRNVLESTANIRRTTATAEAAAADVRAALTTGDVRQSMANLRRASENLAAFSAQLQTAAGGVPGLVARADTTVASFGRTAESLNQAVRAATPALQEVAPTIVEARNALATLNLAIQKINEGEGTLGRLIDDPALFEETQRAIVTLRRLLADIQANPGKYIGQLQIF
ncbi:MAG TPA: MlaD family protein [Longimicrobiaceae bacterium]|nr:MlaD family protein [Longimicrobiaceae bacterium]